MPCPLFVPDGDFFAGYCAADAAEPIPAATLSSCCHTGYARDRCERAARADADSIRLAMKSSGQVAWAIERNHHPVAVGVAGAENPGTGDEVLDAQIRAYARSALSR